MPEKIRYSILPAFEEKVLTEEENISDSTDIVENKPKPLLSELPVETQAIVKRNKRRKLSDASSHRSLNLYKRISVSSKDSIKKVDSISNEHATHSVHELEFPINNEFLNNIDNQESTALVKTNDTMYYDVIDEKKGKIKLKTRIIDSTEKIIAEDFLKTKDNIVKHIEFHSTADLRNFCWDNINEYYNRELKNKNKNPDEIKVYFL
jgi:hypothetical protein